MPDFLITIDVEDWFQVENLRQWNPVSTWDQRELRVERNVHALLDLFDACELNAESSTLIGTPADAASPPASSPRPPATRKVRCTCFILGWLAERLPHLVREIAGRGHEVASHGYSHRMSNGLEDAELKSDLLDSKRLLEDITGREVAGFRAPNFSVDDRVLGVIRECGYRYDSSYNSFALHGRYGKISLDGNRMGIACRVAEDLYELPVSNLQIFSSSFSGTSAITGPLKRFILPWSGGGYFRVMPLHLFKWGVRSILKADSAYVFYMHPWEIDPGQPRVEGVSLAHRFRHYTNLDTTGDKLREMIETFADCRFVSCGEYLDIRDMS